MSARQLSPVQVWEFRCDRCDLTVRCHELPAGWSHRRTILLCPGCHLDLLRFLTNRAAMKQLSGPEYRHPDPVEREALEAELAAKGVGW